MTADDAGTVPEADSGPAPAVPAPRHRRARPKRWRAWRRGRPFWGGLLLVLAGLELLAIPLSGVLVHGAIKLVIYIGIGGVFGVLIGALLIAAGLVIWFNPVHRTFYGIAGIVLGIVSFPASNLGGLIIGMLLAILGGSLAFAWTPAQAAPAADPLPAAVTPPDGEGAEVVPFADLMAPAGEAPAQDAAAAAAESAAEPASPQDTRLPDAETQAALS